LISLASTMHDVGKIAIPDAILLKPGPLSTEPASGMAGPARPLG
jgi:response regulator RpfG family c-di-GMP phosphodiesterase